jgi:acyl carrier protein
MVLEKIKDVVVKRFKVPAEKVSPATRLREDLNVDSLDAVQLIMDLEDLFAISINDDEAQSFKTVGDIVTFVEAKLG